MKKMRQIVINNENYTWAAGHNNYDGDGSNLISIWKNKQKIYSELINGYIQVTPSLIKQIIDGINNSTKVSKIDIFTGKAWKHHKASNFISGSSQPHPNGAGAGGTIFLDYERMLEYFGSDVAQWWVCELELQNDPIRFDFGNTPMVTILVNKPSKEGFKPIKLS